MTALGRVRRVATGLLGGVCLVVLAVAVLVPRLAGATPYTVLTGSMTPGLPPGTLVVSRPVDPDAIATGDVITYQLESGRPEVVTHRVVQVAAGLDGEVRWQTRGDANGAPDQEWVRPEQVRGELWYSVPHLGRVASVLDPQRRALLVQGIAVLLLAYAAGMFTASLRRAQHAEAGPHQARTRSS